MADTEAKPFDRPLDQRRSLVTGGGAQIGPEDLPLADINNVGAVRPGDGLAVAGDGTLNIDNVIAAGEGTKIRYSEQGLVLAL